MPRRPRKRRPRAARPYALLTAAALAACDAFSLAAPADAGAPLHAASAELAQLVNRYRAHAGCRALAWHDGAAGVAQTHSADMHARGYFGHTTPEGRTLADRLRAAHLAVSAAGENLVRTEKGARAAFDAWLASPPHRALLRDCGFTYQGLGLSGDLWTQVLLTPR